VGFLNTGAHFLLIEAFRMAEAALVAPVRYTGLIWAVVLGYVGWGDLPDAWVVVGAGVIVASGIYMIRMESRPRAALEQPAA
jgi:drug/metabolite transporter (DMT)-like permease